MRMRICQALDLSVAHGVDFYRPHWLEAGKTGAPFDIGVRVIGAPGEPILVLSANHEPWLPGHEDLFADDWEVI